MRLDVKYSLTEKCENCTTGLTSTWTVEINVEYIDSTVSLGSSDRQSARNMGASFLHVHVRLSEFNASLI
jgi:hypothetical protein